MKISAIGSQIVALPNDEPLAGFSENPNATNPNASTDGASMRSPMPNVLT